nr:hypothetical protein [Nocardioides houyundeii]
MNAGDGNDVLIDGDGDDPLVKGDPGDDTFFVGAGKDKIFGEQGNDTVYLYDDGDYDEILCDDVDDRGTSAEGKNDKVIYVGRIDPLDKLKADYGPGTCESITVIDYLPEGWPYGPVPGLAAGRAAGFQR